MDINSEFKIKAKKKKSKKTVILLQNSYNTFENYKKFLDEYLKGNHNEYPHFFVRKNGSVYQFLDDNAVSHVSDIENFYKLSINIVLENMGYYVKMYDNDKEYLSDWLGNKRDIKELVYKNYKSYNYWDGYPETQIKALSELCTYLCDKHNIDKDIYSHNYTITEVPDIRNFNGVLSRSNVHLKFLDLHDAFDHKLFKKLFVK